MRRFQPQSYPSYTETGNSWLGSIPAHWQQKRVKDQLRSLDYRRIPLSAEERGKMTNPQYNYYGASGVIDKVDDYLFDQTTILIGEDGANLLMRGSALAFLAKGKYWVNNHAHILKPRCGSIEYLCYLLESFDYTECISGSAQPKFTAGELQRVPLMIPPLPEQLAIAEYLDREAGAIDRKVELLEKKAQLYLDLKQSLINETVTRGLDKSTPLRDSGVDWIGRIPEHWTIDRIGTAFEERSQKVNSLKCPALSVTMSGIVPQLESAAKSKHDDNRKRVVIGDFVINSRSDRRGSSGVSSLDGSVSVISIVLKPRKQFHGKYLHHLFRSYRFIEEFYRVGQGIVADLWTTRYSVMKAIEFAFPPIAEQEAIASYLDEKAEKIDRIVETVETQIDKLKELRKSLINDVVTGKIRVTQPTAAEVV